MGRSENEKEKEMKTSIIVPVRYRADLTQVCIDSIFNYTKDYELILVQEGEDEEISRLFNRYKVFKKNKFIQNKVPKGYAGALNTGMELATGEIYCFMNNDTVATPGWLDEMLKAFNEPKVGLVSPTFWGTGERQSVDWNKEGVDFDWVLEPLSLIGVCFLIPREEMEQLKDPDGKWDEDFIHGGEDFDMTIRIQRLGYRLCIARKSFIYHYGGASTRIYLGNDLQTIRKHHYERVLQLIKKHNLDAQDVFERLQIK